MASFADKFLQMTREGRKIEIGPVMWPTLSKEDAIERLRGPIILYYGGASGYGFRDARYVFDFSVNKWEKELENISGLKESGQIPEEAATAFLETVWPICNLHEPVYKTESTQVVPTSDEERYIFQSDTKRLTWFRALISGKMFEWIAETDMMEPYCILTAAFTELLVGLDI